MSRKMDAHDFEEAATTMNRPETYRRRRIESVDELESVAGCGQGSSISTRMDMDSKERWRVA
jgi:hypothetical protein